MTVAVAEQGVQAASAGASEASAGAGVAVRRGGRTQQGSRQQARTGGRTQQGSQRARPAAASTAQRQQEREQKAQDRARKARRDQIRRAIPATPASHPSYQVVVLGEFVAAVILVAATPFAKRDSPGVSPYAAQDMLQLVAITIVFFILALVSGASPGAGRFAAWFGGLILLTVGLGEAVRLVKLLNVFGVESAKQAKTDEAALTTPAGGQ